MIADSTKDFLLSQARQPGAAIQDLRKGLYQSVFGCEHLVTDPAAARDAICRESRDRSGPSPLPVIQPLDGPWCRVSLDVLVDGLSPDTLAAALIASAALPHGSAQDLEKKLTVLLALSQKGLLPFSPRETEAEICAWQAAGLPPCHHSESYRAANRPAYRVLHRRYVQLLPLLTAIDRALAEKDRVLLAIEGGSAAGKSTLADLLAGLYPSAAVFHADDFFLRPEQRTAERYAQPGGNLDRERLEAEILQPLRQGRAVVYRPFDCGTMSLKPSVAVQQERLNIVEGAYSLHPELAGYYDLSVFLDVRPEIQRQRILDRNGPDWGRMFFQRWIPLEQTYFDATNTPGRCSLRLKMEAVL